MSTFGTSLGLYSNSFGKRCYMDHCTTCPYLYTSSGHIILSGSIRTKFCHATFTFKHPLAETCFQMINRTIYQEVTHFNFAVHKSLMQTWELLSCNISSSAPWLPGNHFSFETPILSLKIQFYHLCSYNLRPIG